MSSSSPAANGAQSLESPAKRSRHDDARTAAVNGNGTAMSDSHPMPAPAAAPAAPAAQPAAPSKPRTCLLIVDVQNDFCTGSLAAPDALRILPVINALRVQYEWDLVVFSADAHPTDHCSFYTTHASDPKAKKFELYTLPNGTQQMLWPVHCVKGSWGWQLQSDVVRDPADVVVEKGQHKEQEFYSAFVGVDGVNRTGLGDLLQSRGITHVAACGLVWEYCVGNSALDAQAAGFRTVLVADATKGLGEEAVDAMNGRLAQAGVKVAQAAELAQFGFRARTETPSLLMPAAKGSSSNSWTLPPSLAHLTAPSVPGSLLAPKPASGSGRPRVLLGLSGSVAAIKAAELLAELTKWAEVRVILTQRAAHFCKPDELARQFSGVQVLQDADEWDQPWQRGDAVLHVELRKWADVFVIAPLSANSLAKLANGLCDNLLSCVVRCWPLGSAPLLLGPAMNTVMWQSAHTARHLRLLGELGAVLIPPTEKTLACGDVGMGAMAEPLDVDRAVRDAWERLSEQSGGGAQATQAAAATQQRGSV